MAQPCFVLEKIGISGRFRFSLKDEEGATILVGQLRHQKPMCLDEMKWIRKIAHKDSSYERIDNQKGCFYIIRAGDGHELGRGAYHDSEASAEQEMLLVKKHAADADFIDMTPDEKRIRAKDYTEGKSAELLKGQGITFG